MTSTSRFPRWLLPASLVATALLSCVSLSYRYRIEQRNRATGIAVEMDAVREIAASQGVLPDDALSGLRDAGLTAVVLSEQTVEDLSKSGQLRMDAEGTILAPKAILDRIDQGVRRRFPLAQVERTDDGLSLNLPNDLALRASVGIDPLEAARVGRNGLEVIARHSNVLGVQDSYVKGMIEDSSSKGARYFLPQGEQVLGRRDAIKSLVEALRVHDTRYLSPEFAKITGDANVKLDAPELVVRLHAAQAAELDRMTESEIVERYVKAARERNIRMLLVRPAGGAGDAALREFGDLLAQIKVEVLKEGGGVGEGKPFEDPRVPKALFVLIALASAPTLLSVGFAFVSSSRGRWAGSLLVALLALGAYADSIRPYSALAIATLLPIAAFLWVDEYRPRFWALGYLTASMISLVGGLAVAGLMNSLEYTIQADMFTGVKVAHFLPIAVVAAWAIGKLTSFRSLFGQPMVWGPTLLIVLGLGFLVFMQSRTGNDNPAGVSSLELRIRSMLEAFLVVRPRTKEFLIGHPAMAFGMALLTATRPAKPGWGAHGTTIAALLVVGSIGQTSVVNTMCHFHTPLTVSLTRIGIGLLLGGILGGLIWVAARGRILRNVN
ncbi:MAG: hypothetical protein KIS66_11755 [Fimbriimonadaceae bacterium]|nr:hypothetical protein [Fimbriimonadaceae bacterium]